VSSGTIDLLAPLGESVQLPELRVLEAEPFYELGRNFLFDRAAIRNEFRDRIVGALPTILKKAMQAAQSSALRRA
jgi:hypothetical protein